jgi:hypothetical protein
VASRSPAAEVLDDARALVGAFLEGQDAYGDVLVQIVSGQPDADARAHRFGELCGGAVAIAAMYLRREAEAAGVTPAEALQRLARAVADSD